MKSYAGSRMKDGTACVAILDDAMRALPARLDLDNHSPTGFEWGYGGSGPAQLALALLADALGHDASAARLHQSFKWKFIAPLAKNERWTMTLEDVLRHAAAISEWPLVRLSDGTVRCSCPECTAHLVQWKLLISDKLGIYSIADDITPDQAQAAYASAPHHHDAEAEA